MVVGFNHNFRYRGTLYHVQTEDGGLKSPQIVTLLFSGGTILASRKTSYADIVKVNNLEQVVEELMKEQHREMLRQLKDGEFDDLIRQRLGQGLAPGAPGNGGLRGKPPIKPQEALPPRKTPVPSPAPAPAPRPPAPQPAQKGSAEPSLDDIILSYLIGDSGKKS
jgi:hypothetical protein